MRGTTGSSVGCVAAAVVFFAAAGLAQVEGNAASGCGPRDGMEFVCGPTNAEDLLQLPGTSWLIASGMSGEMAEENTPGHLYLLDPAEQDYQELFPGSSPELQLDSQAFPDCPGKLNPNDFSAHGLSLHARSDGSQRLYVTSHGEREAVEIFDVHVDGSQPTVSWVGCVPIPAHNDINSVAALSDGGFLTTRISGTGPEQSGDIFNGDLSGFLYEWHPGGDISRVPHTEMSGPNGIIVSDDDSTVYVGSWGRSEIARFVRSDDGRLRHERTMHVGFRVDNLRWTDEGTVLAAGHRLASSQDCGQPLCFDEWEVAEIDPESMTMNTLLIREPMPGFSGATVAIRQSDGLWLGTFHGDRIVHVPEAGGERRDDRTP